MNKYRPKHLLEKAIKATEECLDTKWSNEKVEGNTVDINADCALCDVVTTDCSYCPLYQFDNNHSIKHYFCCRSYERAEGNPTRNNFRIMRKTLKDMLKWLKAQA